MSFWACSRLFQKLSPAIKASSSPRRFCAPGKSKKPPQVSGFFRGGSDLTFGNLKHAAQTYRSAWRLTSGFSQIFCFDGRFGASILRIRWFIFTIHSAVSSDSQSESGGQPATGHGEQVSRTRTPAGPAIRVIVIVL